MKGLVSTHKTPRVTLNKPCLFSGPRDSITSPSKVHCGAFGGPHLPHPYTYPFCRRDLSTLHGLNAATSSWSHTIYPSSDQISRCLLGTPTSTRSLGAWVRLKSFRAGPHHGLSPNLPRWRPVGYRRGTSYTLPMTQGTHSGNPTPPHFITIASCLSASAPDLTSLCPAPHMAFLPF